MNWTWTVPNRLIMLFDIEEHCIHTCTCSLERRAPNTVLVIIKLKKIAIALRLRCGFCKLLHNFSLNLRTLNIVWSPVRRRVRKVVIKIRQITPKTIQFMMAWRFIRFSLRIFCDFTIIRYFDQPSYDIFFKILQNTYCMLFYLGEKCICF